MRKGGWETSRLFYDLFYSLENSFVFRKKWLSLQYKAYKKIEWTMMYLNQFHKEAVERKVRKIAESKKSPMSSIAAAAYMKKNFEKAKTM